MSLQNATKASKHYICPANLAVLTIKPAHCRRSNSVCCGTDYWIVEICICDCGTATAYFILCRLFAIFM